ncbi:sugar transferase [Sphingomonas oleivorans]|uniref:Sugar transferase n=1 Tax=Sphingomonas oleivorans TaxID=1735121 RepID=A0A2T5FYY6_9SPHN|nr:sugar transferase [Sphingomonas oleivorans]PTQ11798.1 sugar transferase [Sphingomonas oleivorans]
MNIMLTRMGLTIDPSYDRIFQRPKSRLRIQLYAIAATFDIVSISSGFMLASLVRHHSPFHSVTWNLIGVIIPVFLLTALNLRAYGFEILDSASRSIKRALTAFATAIFLVFGIAFYFQVGDEISRFIVSSGTLASSLLLIAGRSMLDRLASRIMPDGPTNKLILCDGTSRAAGRGEKVVDTLAAGLQPRLDDPFTLDRLGQLARNADRIIVSCPPARREAWANALKGANIDTELLMPELEQLGILGVEQFDGAPTAIVGRGPLRARERFIKRTFDLCAILWCLPLLAVVWAIVAILIKLEDGGPVFFMQKRIGEGNRIFPIYKFRTMRSESLDAEGRISTARNDRRVTRIGRILRATSIDELPQLLNVLKGDMSIVGPRPHALASTAGDALFWEVDQRYWGRHAAKPGLTGLAQIRGFRGATACADDLTNRVQADLDYLSGWTLWRDIKIVFATSRVLLHNNAF